MSNETPASAWPLLGYGSGSMLLASYYLISGAYLLFATAILGLPAGTCLLYTSRCV